MQIKAADGRAADIASLERLLDRPDLPSATRKRIESEIRNIRAGEKAEQDAAYEIEFWFGSVPNWATIHDLRIEVDGLVAQMDHVIVNRLCQIWLCESKSFAEGVSVNEHGEWSRWWHGRPEGMPSPIEQNRRHVALLERAFDQRVIGAPRRLGLVPLKPEIRSVVLVSSNARIGRPKRRVDGIDTVVKADQLKTRLMEEFDRASTWRLATVIGKEGLADFAQRLASLHRPGQVDWAARFGLSPVRPEATFPPPSGSRLASQPTGTPCSRCGRPVSDVVVRYCLDHQAVFGGAVYCMNCQSFVRSRVERPLILPEWSAVLRRYENATRLSTAKRDAPFIVATSGLDLRVIPDSSGRARTITETDFRRSAEILAGGQAGTASEVSRNSSYVEAILRDLQSGRRSD